MYSASPFYTQGTHMPSSGSFVTMYLAELHFENGYMEIGLLISNLHGLFSKKKVSSFVVYLLFCIDLKWRFQTVIFVTFHFITSEKVKKSWSKRDEPTQSTSKVNIHQKKVMLSVWWDFKGIVYFELLPRNQTINSNVCCRQLIKLDKKIK